MITNNCSIPPSHTDINSKTVKRHTLIKKNIQLSVNNLTIADNSYDMYHTDMTSQNIPHPIKTKKKKVHSPFSFIFVTFESKAGRTLHHKLLTTITFTEKIINLQIISVPSQMHKLKVSTFRSDIYHSKHCFSTMACSRYYFLFFSLLYITYSFTFYTLSALNVSFPHVNFDLRCDV